MTSWFKMTLDGILSFGHYPFRVVVSMYVDWGSENLGELYLTHTVGAENTRMKYVDKILDLYDSAAYGNEAIW